MEFTENGFLNLKGVTEAGWNAQTILHKICFGCVIELSPDCTIAAVLRAVIVRHTEVTLDDTLYYLSNPE
jgi:hypothetical protein